MVWGVCRRILRDHHDAEDAFQATFLVLVRKASSIKPRCLVGNWLYGVARQTALKARATTAKRREREIQMTAWAEPAVKPPDLPSDLSRLLDDELTKLPDKYRCVLILCGLQGKPLKEAARRLDLPEGTVASRLARGRAMLAKRLVRHGLAVSGVSLVALQAHQSASAGVSTAAISSTIKAAPAAGVVSANVGALTSGVLKAMLLSKLKVAMAVVLIAVTCIGVGVLTHTALAARPSEAAKEGAEKQTVVAEIALERAKDVSDVPKAEEKPKADLSKKEPDADEDGVEINTPIPLREAVEELNRKTDKEYFDTKIWRQPPLAKERRPKAVTVDEVVSAIQGWDRKKQPVADPTYRIFQQIADSKVLPPGTQLTFLDLFSAPFCPMVASC